MKQDPELMKVLEPVQDPEIMMSIVELGLIYGVEKTDDESVACTMTFTSPACPMGPQLIAAVETALKGVEWVKKTKVDVVFKPAWDPKVMCSEDAKMKLGIF